jgi:hypothetical protein
LASRTFDQPAVQALMHERGIASPDR